MVAKDEHGPCPLTWGDRVEHPKFGFGTVEGEPVPAFGPIMEAGRYGVGPKGWTVQVRWEDPNRAPSKIGFDPKERPFLVKVFSPDARGHAYWENEFHKRLGPVEKIRAEIGTYLKSSFRARPGFSRERLAELQARETHALTELQAFLAADEAGEHP